MQEHEGKAVNSKGAPFFRSPDFLSIFSDYKGASPSHPLIGKWRGGTLLLPHASGKTSYKTNGGAKIQCASGA